MDYASEIRTALQNPQQLETLYHQAQQAGDVTAFIETINQLYLTQPAQLLLAAWHYRLRPVEQDTSPTITPNDSQRPVNWRAAILLSIGLSMFSWVIIDFSGRSSDLPDFMLFWVPVAVCTIIAYLTLNAWHAKTIELKHAIGIAVALGLLTTYAVWRAQPPHTNYGFLMLPHLPLFSWMAVCLCLVRIGLERDNLFAFIIKSIEVGLTAGIFLGVAAVFAGVTNGLFAAIGIRLSDPIQRLLLFGVPGLIPVIAVATTYDSTRSPVQQRFDQGLARLVSMAGRFVTPLTLIVLVAYTLTIPFNFWKPFAERDVLIVYNVMLFAIMGLLLSATPLTHDMPARWERWLRYTLMLIAALTVLISLYAMSATVYRTVLGGLTMNRLTIIGWNTINLTLLCLFLYRQLRAAQASWIAAAHAVFRMGVASYLMWTLFLILVIPLLFA